MYRTKGNPPLFRWKLFDRYSSFINTAVTTRKEQKGLHSDRDFNLALHTGDLDQSVIGNRKKLCSSQSISFESYTCARQVHGADIHVVDSSSAGKGRESYGSSIIDADALIVTERDIMINIHVADCVPLVLYDYKQNAGALIHGGWRGTARLITEKTIQFMVEKLHCSPRDMIAGIGPSIGGCCFQIGEDTAETLADSFDYSSKVIVKNRTISADLKQANLEQMLSAGIADRNIEISDLCTKCSNDEFYSHRAESGKTGRFSAFLSLL